MYKVFIVDDEQFIRMELIGLIDWNKYGFEVIGEARNGNEALKYLSDKKVDLLITDIEMPFISGIELTEQLKADRKDIEVIFLTGFSDFEFARKGINLGIREYLLKPVNEKELIDVLQIIYNSLNEKNKIEGDEENGTGYKDILIEKSKLFVKERIDKEINLAEVSSYLNISKNYFCTLFKKETKENFSEYVAKEKINVAKRLLIQENLKVYEVADRLGYSDKNNFSKLFKKYVGVTPLDYKKNGNEYVKNNKK